MYILAFFCLTAVVLGKPHNKNYVIETDTKNQPCGKPFFAPKSGATSYIVGGEEANQNSWPWQALLLYRGSLTCGGTLVRNSNGGLVVVTAAHCVDGSLGTASRWTVKLGSHRVSQDGAYTQSFAVSQIVKHELYNPSTIDNDIALMKLSGTVQETDGVIPACMASRDHGINEMCAVTGWGTTAEGGSIADRLQQVYKPVLSDNGCSSFLGSSYNRNTMLCAGFEQGGADACQGDSGGPLVCERNGFWELVGVVSWGYGCARPELPGVYADVWNFKSWVESNWN